MATSRDPSLMFSEIESGRDHLSRVMHIQQLRTATWYRDGPSARSLGQNQGWHFVLCTCSVSTGSHCCILGCRSQYCLFSEVGNWCLIRMVDRSTRQSVIQDGYARVTLREPPVLPNPLNKHPSPVLQEVWLQLTIHGVRLSVLGYFKTALHFP